MKILLIDDSLLDRKLMMNILKKAGIANEILQAPNGEEGLQIMVDHFSEICLIVLDWQMPKMDGIGFMKAAGKISEAAHIPIVMVTASGSDEDKRLAREVNPRLAGYIVKPYTAQTLIKTVDPFLTVK
ncbi:MAG: response regulator [Candidatus Omnitrophica bacterium]|nr:response regulator [Candidatus Omnitrophota bacterium]